LLAYCLEYWSLKLERQARVNRPEESAILARGCSNFNDTHFLTVFYKLSHPPLFQEALVLIFESIHCVRLGSRNPARLSIDMKILIVIDGDIAVILEQMKHDQTTF